jgi:hypothetical protein
MQRRLHRFAAPAALGLLAPFSAQAADLSLAALNQYGSREQVTSIQQFSDVRPTDWAYQALSNLIERYGCVAGYPSGAFKGGQAMSRYEAAALLNACLDRITEVTDELKRLMKEFEKELAVLKGRVDGLEARVGELEATQFSTTTKLKGLATFVLGANQFSGSAVDVAANKGNRVSATSPTFNLPNATTFSYDLQLTLDTSFTGKDLLRTNLRAGNFGDSVFGGEPHALGLAELEAAYQEDCGTNTDCGDVVAIDKLFYQFPLGSGLTATVGPRVGQEDMLALWPNVYPSDTILNVMTVNGAPAAYNKNRGAGAGLWWENNGFSVSANYVATNGDVGNPGEGGLGNGHSGSSGTVQLGYATKQWGLAAIWSLVQPETEFVPGTTPFTHGAIDHNTSARTNAYALSGYWQPLSSGWMPSISAGWGINQTVYDMPMPEGKQLEGSLRTSQSWMVGLQWTDVFLKGNDFGFAVAQPVFATALYGDAGANDGNVVWEWWYKFQVTDQITVTPALIYLSRPLGQATPAGDTFSQFGGLIKTSFKF